MYLVNGLGNTLRITAVSLLLGIVLGAIAAIVRVSYANNKKRGVGLTIGNFICGLYLTIIRGTPTVVQLMIMAFAIWTSGNPIAVAMVSFGINTGAYIAEIVRGGIQSIDRGQMEAGRSLGLSYNQTMRKIIIPQAFRNCAPALFNEFIVLLKETSVAGYVGIQDLTKGGDIIRSITYDAFPPLLAVAGIYLVFVIILTQILHVIERRLAQSDLR
ncbi:MAG: amino acid ABC transporter permease [Lachnospiraceae bacterium]|nr:amino acid ABC transporter permease [Lachnospiraceae bacterium]